MDLAGIEHYTSSLPHYSANHYTYHVLKICIEEFKAVNQRKFKSKEIDLTPRYKIMNCRSYIIGRAFIVSVLYLTQ